MVVRNLPYGAVALGDTTNACGEVVFALRRCLSPGGRRIVCR